MVRSTLHYVLLLSSFTAKTQQPFRVRSSAGLLKPKPLFHQNKIFQTKTASHSNHIMNDNNNITTIEMKFS